MKIDFPKKVFRNAYVRVFATFTEEEMKDPSEAFYQFSFKTWGVMGVRCTEDNTVGQIAMERQIKERGSCSGGFNLYGLRVTEINKRLREA